MHHFSSIRIAIISIFVFTFLISPVSSQTSPPAPKLATPKAVSQCLATNFTWTGGTPPYMLFLTSGSSSSGKVLKTFDNITGHSFSWRRVSLASGTVFVANLIDSEGRPSTTGRVTVKEGEDKSCVNGDVEEQVGGEQTGSTTGTSTSTSTSTGTRSSPSSGSESSTTSQTTEASSSAASTGTAPIGSATQTGAAIKLPVGAASVVGFIGALFL